MSDAAAAATSATPAAAASTDTPAAAPAASAAAGADSGDEAAVKMVTLVSKDGDKFQVPCKDIKISKLVETFLANDAEEGESDDDDPSSEIPLPQVESAVLVKVRAQTCICTFHQIILTHRRLSSSPSIIPARTWRLFPRFSFSFSLFRYHNHYFHPPSTRARRRPQCLFILFCCFVLFCFVLFCFG